MLKNNYLWLSVCVLISFSILTGCSKSATPPPEKEAATTADEQVSPPVGRLDGAVEPVRYDIELRIDPSQDRFSGVVSIDVSMSENTNAIWLHGKHLDVTEAYLIDNASNRVNVSYEEMHPSGVALLTLERSVEAGPATLHFTYNAAFNTSVNALFKVERGGEFYAASQLEAIAARQVFPGFDEPGFKVPFDLGVVARADDAVVTTTPLASKETLSDGFVRHVFETTRPLPTYLLAFVVGPYDVVDFGTIPPNSIRDRELPLRGIAARGLGDRLEYALKNTEGLLTELEEYFGTPYPYRKLDIIAAPESFGGAMENVGAIVYDEYLLLMDEDSPLGQRRSYTSVHSHEMAHMWFGDLVTPVWWNDIWLNESFASWMEYKAAHGYWPEGEFDRELLKGALFAMASDSLASARQIREPVDHSDEISSAFDGITYEKGAGVLAMLERYVGQDRFRDGVRLHMERHSDGSATAEDFIASLAEGTERVEIEAAFKSFIEQPGVPLLSVSLDCEDEGHPRLHVSQARYAPLGSSIEPATDPWHIPMCVAFTDDGMDKSSCTLLSEKQQTINLDAGSCPTQVYPNADGAGYFRFSLDKAAWESLISNAASLPPAEALVLADNLDAGFRAGTVAAKTYASGMAALINHDAWDVADSATAYLEGIADIVEQDELGPMLEAFQRISLPRFANLEDASDSGSQLLRRRMQRFLIIIAREPSMRAELAAQAAAIVGLNGDPDLSAAPASQHETVLSVGVQDLGAAFFDLLLEQALASEDPQFRGAAIGALARVEDPALIARLQSALLSKSFKAIEFRRIVTRQMVRQATTESTYAWLKENFDAVLERMPQGLSGNRIATLGSSFCTNDKADAWQAFIVANADNIPGYERKLSQATESVRLCAALRDASAGELVAAFQVLQ